MQLQSKPSEPIGENYNVFEGFRLESFSESNVGYYNCLVDGYFHHEIEFYVGVRGKPKNENETRMGNESKEIEITPEPKNHDLTVLPGQPCSFKCRSSEPVKWITVAVIFSFVVSSRNNV